MLPPQDGRMMSQGNELKFQRGTAAKTEFEDRNKGPENRHHRDGTADPRKSPALHQPCGILSKDSPRLAVTALIDGQDFAERLEKAIERSHAARVIDQSRANERPGALVSD
jgi:hypothetical protein